MAVDMIEQNELMPIRLISGDNVMGDMLREKHERTKDFSGEELSNDARAQQETDAEITQRYPIPVDCADCTAKIALMEQDVETTRQRIAQGATKNIGNRQIAALQDRIGKFKKIGLNWQCVQKADQAESEAFLDSVKNTLNGEQDRAGAKTSTTSALVYVGGALLLAGALLLILKHAKKD